MAKYLKAAGWVMGSLLSPFIIFSLWLLISIFSRLAQPSSVWFLVFAASMASGVWWLSKLKMAVVTKVCIVALYCLVIGVALFYFGFLVLCAYAGSKL
jgi:hypothetical protein